MGTVTALKQKPAGTSFGDMLKKTATAEKPKAKKSSMPTLTATPEVAEAVDKYQESKINHKQAEAAMNDAGETIMAFVRDHQDAEGFEGRYQGSFAVIGNRHQAKVIYQNKFSINPEDEGELTSILGDRFDTLIQKKYSVRLKAVVLDDEELQAELMDLIGERFGDFFETTASLTVAEGFAKEIYQAVIPEQLPALRTFARQYKPSIR